MSLLTLGQYYMNSLFCLENPTCLQARFLFGVEFGQESVPRFVSSEKDLTKWTIVVIWSTCSAR